MDYFPLHIEIFLHAPDTLPAGSHYLSFYYEILANTSQRRRVLQILPPFSLCKKYISMLKFSDLWYIIKDVGIKPHNMGASYHFCVFFRRMPK